MLPCQDFGLKGYNTISIPKAQRSRFLSETLCLLGKEHPQFYPRKDKMQVSQKSHFNKSLLTSFLKDYISESSDTDCASSILDE